MTDVAEALDKIAAAPVVSRDAIRLLAEALRWTPGEAAAAPSLDVELITEYVAITISKQKNGLGISYNEARAIGAEVAARLLSEKAPSVGSGQE